MKKIIGIVIASLVFANIGFAEMRLIEKKRITEHRISTWCVDGYKFIVSRNKSGTISTVQFYETVDHIKRAIGTALPAKC